MNRHPLDSRDGDASELFNLFGMVGDEAATTEQIQQLEGLLRTDHSIVTSFVQFMFLHAMLERNFEIVRPHNASPLPHTVQPKPTGESTLSVPAPSLPLHHPPRHGRLFLLGLAGGVSDRNGDFRDRAANRLSDACVLSAADR